MTHWKAFFETVHLAALGVWLGVVAAAGGFAASVFPVMRELDPKLPAFGAYAGEHWLIMGGAVAQRVFLLTDIVQFVCAVLAMGTLGCLIAFLGLPRQRPATIVRACALGLALACAAGSIIIVAPPLNAALKMYWRAAQVGDMGAVAVHKAAVDELHPIASKLMAGTVLAVFVAFIAGLWATARPWEGAKATAASRGRGRYEEPTLLRGKRA